MGSAAMRRVTLKGRGDLAEWRDVARRLLAEGVLPEAIDWREATLGGDLFGTAGERLLLEPTERPSGCEAGVRPAGSSPVSVPPAFISLAEAVICHSDPGRVLRCFTASCFVFAATAICSAWSRMSMFTGR